MKWVIALAKAPLNRLSVLSVGLGATSAFIGREAPARRPFIASAAYTMTPEAIEVQLRDATMELVNIGS